MKRSSAFLAMLVVAGLLMGSSAVWAQGYSVYEQSACTTARGGATVASPCEDGSAMYFNPAGLSFDAKVLGLGAAIIGPRGNFTDNKTGLVSPLNDKWYPVPNVYFSTPLGKRVAAGVGVFAPYGLTTDWPITSQGRFLGYKSVVQGIYVQPTVAFKLNDRVQVGVGVDITYLNVELRQRVDLASQVLLVHPLLGTLTFADLNKVCPAAACGTVTPGTDFADVQLKGHAYHAGAHLGFLAKATDRVSIGARWMSGQRVKISNGTITTQQISVPNVKVPVTGVGFVPVDTVMAGKAFAAGQTLSSPQAATSEIPLPDQFVAGIAIQAAPQVKLLVDYEFTRWSMFDVLPINGAYLKSQIVESYKNTNGVRVGTEIGLSKGLVLRAGFDGHGASAPAQTVTPNLPEAARQEYTIGLGANLSPNVRLDVGYMYLHQENRAGRTGPGGVEANNGIYSFKANIPTVMLAFRF